MIDSNRVPSFGDTSIIPLNFLLIRKKKNEVNDNVPWLSLANIISSTNIITIELDCKKLSSF